MEDSNKNLCNLCNKTFKSNYILQRHINQPVKCNVIPDIIYDQKENKNICNLCNKTFKSNYILQRHLNQKNKCNQINIPVVIEPKKLIKCKNCNMTFRTEYLLNKHKNKKDTCYNQPEVKKLNHTQLQKKIYNIQYKINTLFKDSLNTEDNTGLYCNKFILVFLV